MQVYDAVLKRAVDVPDGSDWMFNDAGGVQMLKRVGGIEDGMDVSCLEDDHEATAKLGRPRVGKEVMSGAERVRRHRARKAINHT